MANTALENNIDLSIQTTANSSSYADTILGNIPLDINNGVNINLDVAISTKFSVVNTTFVIEN